MSWGINSIQSLLVRKFPFSHSAVPFSHSNSIRSQIVEWLFHSVTYTLNVPVQSQKSLNNSKQSQKSLNNSKRSQKSFKYSIRSQIVEWLFHSVTNSLDVPVQSQTSFNNSIQSQLVWMFGYKAGAYRIESYLFIYIIIRAEHMYLGNLKPFINL